MRWSACCIISRSIVESTGNASVMTQLAMFAITLTCGLYLKHRINYTTGYADTDEAAELASKRKLAKRSKGESFLEFMSRMYRNIFNGMSEGSKQIGKAVILFIISYHIIYIMVKI